MKTIRLFSAILGISAACALRAADTAAPAPRVTIVFDHPENFADVKDSEPGTDKGRDAILASIRNFMVSKDSRMLPEGYSLTVTFTDIHLAGAFEPWRGPQWDEVRIVKDIYPPSFKFTYNVTDPSGRVVKEGAENILDMNFQTRMILDTTDPLRYEKDILNDWARSTLRDLKKA
jgi:hypothetical protein